MRRSRLGTAYLGVFCLACSLLAHPPLAVAQEDGKREHAATQVGQVAAIVDGATLTLKDGRVVRLSGIEAPAPLPGANSPRTLASRSTAALRDLLGGRTIGLPGDGEPLRSDRYGQLALQVRRSDGLWIQRAMLERGLARVVPLPSDRALLDEMLAAEAEARRQRRGIWATDAFSVRRPSGLRAGLGDFLIIEGQVVAAQRRGPLLVLQIADLRTGLPSSSEAATSEPSSDTVHVEALLPRSVVAEFAALGLDPALAAGWQVRVRGWLERRQGVAQVPLVQREQLEFVAPKDAS